MEKISQNSRQRARGDADASTTTCRGERRPWLRLYRDALHNPKIVLLNDRQHRAWHNCLLVADDDGVLPSMRDIACHLRMTPQEAEWVVGELVEAGLIDYDALSDGPRRYVMHDWSSHQYTSDISTERVRKHRQKKRENREKDDEKDDEKHVKRFCNDDETPPESESDTESESDLVLQPSEQVAAREEREEQKFDLKFLKGMGEGKIDKLKARAEGLGLPVDELVDSLNRNKARNRPAYFTRLCVNRLKAQLPGVEEPVLREALWGNHTAFGHVCRHLLEGAVPC